MLEPDGNYSMKSELLLNASFALRSSLATEGQFDLGTRLSVRLLVPYIKSGDDVEIAAALANTLEHHSPGSDAEANTVLALCQKLVERKNVRVLDGCVSLIIARHRYFLSCSSFKLADRSSRKQRRKSGGSRHPCFGRHCRCSWSWDDSGQHCPSSQAPKETISPRVISR